MISTFNRISGDKDKVVACPLSKKLNCMNPPSTDTVALENLFGRRHDRLQSGNQD